jgi:hypothetical protein
MSESDIKWLIGRAALFAVVALSFWLFGHHSLGLIVGLMGAAWLWGHATGHAEGRQAERDRRADHVEQARCAEAALNLVDPATREEALAQARKILAANPKLRELLK